MMWVPSGKRSGRLPLEPAVRWVVLGRTPEPDQHGAPEAAPSVRDPYPVARRGRGVLMQPYPLSAALGPAVNGGSR